MIKLEIGDYCHNCENFKPITDVFYNSGGTVHTSVYCKHSDGCKLAYEYGYNEGRKDEELAQEEIK